ncbi:MAG: hypothetical protein HZA90_16035 [Verrucomicrobia bacterium]|nr:hypothetical protein [Verrucomicrobiota bacterium]
MKRRIEFVLSQTTDQELKDALERLQRFKDKGWTLIDLQREETTDDNGAPLRLGLIIVEKKS